MNREKQDIDQDVLIKMAATDPAALGLLYDIYYGGIFRYCLHRLGQRQVAEDVTSIVFLTAASQIKKFRGQTRPEFACWLYKISNNKINQHLRQIYKRKKLSERLAEIEMSKSAQTSPESTDQWPLLHIAILELSTVEQAIITLRYFEGLTAARVSEIMGLKASTLRVKLFRTIEKLRVIVNEKFPELAESAPANE